MASPEANVLRNGSRKSIPVQELVPGDVVYLEAGNYVPADVRLIEAVNLRVDKPPPNRGIGSDQKTVQMILAPDASLGNRENLAFMGTVVTYGRGVVVDTGMSTQIGQIAEMLQSVEEEQTPLQKQLNQL